MLRYWFSGILVACAVLVMIALGFWQLERSAEKTAQLARYAVNRRLAPVALSQLDARDPANLFRRVTAQCPAPSRIDIDAGRSARDGASGWRNIATCAAVAGQPPLLVDIGVSRDPAGIGRWSGGPVAGVLITEPQRHGVLARLLTSPPALRSMIVASEPATGLTASVPPDPAALPDDHKSYAIQWFIFAFAAAAIYLIALRQRLRALTVADAVASQ